MHPLYHHSASWHDDQLLCFPLHRDRIVVDFAPAHDSALWQKVTAPVTRANRKGMPYRSAIMAHLAKTAAIEHDELLRVPRQLRSMELLPSSLQAIQKKKKNEIPSHASERMLLCAHLKTDSSATLFQTPEIIVTKEPTLLTQYRLRRERKAHAAAAAAAALEKEAKLQHEAEAADKKKERDRASPDVNEDDEKNDKYGAEIQAKEQQQPEHHMSHHQDEDEAKVKSAHRDTQQFMERSMISRLYDPDWPEMEAKEEENKVTKHKQKATRTTKNLPPPPVIRFNAKRNSETTIPPPIPRRVSSTAPPLPARPQAPAVPPRANQAAAQQEEKQLHVTLDDKGKTDEDVEESHSVVTSTVSRALSRMLRWAPTTTHSFPRNHSPSLSINQAQIAVADTGKQLAEHEAKEYHPSPEQLRSSPPPVPERKQRQQQSKKPKLRARSIKSKDNKPVVPQRPAHLELNQLQRY